MRRRDFLATAAAARGVLGANDKVVVGLIGCGGRGRYVAKRMAEAAGVEFGAVCDVFAPNAAKAREWAGARARTYSDLRRLLEQKDLDAVLIATPDHWHATATVLACAAGKDVYVEKPLAHNVREGQAMVKAARRHNRIVQAGTQQRSATHFPEIARLIRSGELGEVRFVRVWNFLNLYPAGIGKEPDSDAPEGLNWDYYLGPAPKRPFNSKRFLSTFRWFWDYAGGLITDYGTHRFDTVHQIMGEEVPATVVASGRSNLLQDAGEMPNILQVTYEYPGFTLSYEACTVNGHGLGGRTPGMRYYNMRSTEDRPHGMAFYGTKGTVFADRIGYEIYPVEGRLTGNPAEGKVAPPSTADLIQRKSVNTSDTTGLHTANFIQSVRNRRQPFADVLVGHRATLIGHLGNIAFKTGRKLHWDGETESFRGDTAANHLLHRESRREYAWIQDVS